MDADRSVSDVGSTACEVSSGVFAATGQSKSGNYEPKTDSESQNADLIEQLLQQLEQEQARSRRSKDLEDSIDLLKRRISQMEFEHNVLRREISKLTRDKSTLEDMNSALTKELDEKTNTFRNVEQELGKRIQQLELVVSSHGRLDDQRRGNSIYELPKRVLYGVVKQLTEMKSIWHSVRLLGLPRAPPPNPAPPSPLEEFLVRLNENKSYVMRTVRPKRTAAFMFQLGGIVQHQLESIQTAPGHYLKSRKLVNIVLKANNRAMFECFVQALKISKQDDLYLFLTDINCQLQDGPEEILRTRYVYLSDNISVQNSGILCYMWEKGAISTERMAKIAAAVTNTEQAERLLSYLIQKNNDCYNVFLEALEYTHQDHILRELKQAGEAMSVSNSVEKNRDKNQQSSTSAKERRGFKDQSTRTRSTAK